MRLTLAATILLLAACSSGNSAVDWENYSPGVKQSIDASAKAKDCDALQTQFDSAEQMDNTQRKRTGNDGNADLMAYIDEQMKTAGCHT